MRVSLVDLHGDGAGLSAPVFQRAAGGFPSCSVSGARSGYARFDLEDCSVISGTGKSRKAMFVIASLWRDGRLEEAASAGKSLYEESGDPTALAWQGRCLHRLKRHSDALDALRTVGSAEIRAPWFRTLYADVLLANGHEEEALKQLERAIGDSSEAARGALYEKQQWVNRRLHRWDASTEAAKNALAWQIEFKPHGRLAILQRLLRVLDAHRYLEIGVSDGGTFLKLECPTKLAVDPRFQIPGGFFDTEHERWFPVTSDAYFEGQARWLEENPLDLVFVDGLHTYEQSLKDVQNALRYVRPGGLIVMHDCLPSSEAAAAPTPQEAREIRGLAGKGGAGGAWMGDVYRTILHLRSFSDDLHVCVLDSDCGLGIVRRGSPESMLSLSAEEIGKFGYGDLMRTKQGLLNLKAVDWFESFVGSLANVAV
jgi:tetratricopeptide (TPR) repeat protein